MNNMFRSQIAYHLGILVGFFALWFKEVATGAGMLSTASGNIKFLLMVWFLIVLGSLAVRFISSHSKEQ